jgi:hypothetical protein
MRRLSHIAPGRLRCAVRLATLALPLAAMPAGAQSSGDATIIVGRAVTLRGGEAALRGVERVRFDMMTQWQRTGFRDVPWTDRPSFEAHNDVRDYTIPAWRNTRMFGARNIVNVVRDSVALTDFGTGLQPLSPAYVDERDELFLYTPDRLMLALLDAADLAAAGDTIIGGEPFRIVQATTRGGLPVRVFFHTGTGLPALLRFRAEHPNDFGLVPWGEMDVEVWYSAWNSFDGVGLATQWDVLRVGAPYKRMTVRNAAINPVLEPDSFATPQELRAQYLATRGPMHDRQVDSVSTPNARVAAVAGFGFPVGAVRTSAGWYLLEAAHHPLMLERARRALATKGVDALAGAVIVAARTGNGGVTALVEEGVPLFVAPAAEPFVRRMIENAGLPTSGYEVVRTGRWIGTGGERLRLEPVDLPDVPGSLMLYAPEIGWLYAPDAATPLDVRVVTERARALGWTWSAMGTMRALFPGEARDG